MYKLLGNTVKQLNIQGFYESFNTRSFTDNYYNCQTFTRLFTTTHCLFLVNKATNGLYKYIAS